MLHYLARHAHLLGDQWSSIRHFAGDQWSHLKPLGDQWSGRKL